MIIVNKISSKLFEDISPVLFIGALLISSFIFAQDNVEEITVDSVTTVSYTHLTLPTTPYV